MSDVHAEEIVEILKHWKEARESRLNEIEVDENLRCVMDLVGLLAEHGVKVPTELWRKS